MNSLHLFRIVRAKTEYPEYMDAFNDELESFKKRVKERAEARIEKAMKEAEEVRYNMVVCGFHWFEGVKKI